MTPGRDRWARQLRQVERAEREARHRALNQRIRYASPEGMIARLSNWQRKQWQKAGSPKDPEAIGRFLRLQRDGSELHVGEVLPPAGGATDTADERAAAADRPAPPGAAYLVDVIGMLIGRRRFVDLAPVDEPAAAETGVTIDHAPAGPDGKDE